MSKPTPSQQKDDGAQHIRRAPLMLRPLRWIKQLFSTDVRLERSGFQYNVVLVPRGSDAMPPPVVTCDAAPDAPPNPMHAELRKLLAQHANTRHLMRHLAFIEQAMKISGPQALDELPVEVMKKGLLQLESLVSDWSGAGVSELRARLGAAVHAGEDGSKPFLPTNSSLSDFLVSQRMEVSEATPSDFEELERIWIEHVPEGTAVPARVTRQDCSVSPPV